MWSKSRNFDLHFSGTNNSWSFLPFTLLHLSLSISLSRSLLIRLRGENSAFGWTPPKYAHLPLILNDDGTKLSKRYDHARVEHYRTQKIQPLVVLNYITSAGSGLHREVSDDPAINVMSMDEMIDQVCNAHLHRNSNE